MSGWRSIASVSQIPAATSFQPTSSSSTLGKGTALMAAPYNVDYFNNPHRNPMDLGAIANSPTPITVATAGSYAPNGAWQNFGFAQQTGKIQAVYTVGSCNNCSGYLGFSDGALSTYSFANSVVVNKDGQVRSGTTGTPITFVNNASYTFRIVMDRATGTYDAYVKVNGGTEQSLGIGLPFANTVSKVNNFAFIMWGTFTLSDIVITPQ
jgi:hypothetical protein